MASIAVYPGRSCHVSGRQHLIQVIVSLLQSILGSHFFIPKFLQPGRFEYRRPISSLSEDQRCEECPICYTPIDQDVHATDLTSNERYSEARSIEENQDPLVFPKIKHCFSTPCKHNFHKECLTKWFENKPECPVCRTQLPFIE